MPEREAGVVSAIMDKTKTLFAPTVKGAWMKHSPSPYSPAGIPDISGTGRLDGVDGRAIWIECKAPSKDPIKDLSVDQLHRLTWLAAAGAFACSTNKKPVPAGYATYALEVWQCIVNTETGKLEDWQHGWIFDSKFTVLPPPGVGSQSGEQSGSGSGQASNIGARRRSSSRGRSQKSQPEPTPRLESPEPPASQ